MAQKVAWSAFPEEVALKLTAKYYSDEELFNAFIKPVYVKGRELALEELFSRESPTARKYQRNILRYHLFNKTIPTLGVAPDLLKKAQYGFGVNEELFVLLNLAYLVKTNFEDKSLCALLERVTDRKDLKNLDILVLSYLAPNFNMDRDGFHRLANTGLNADPDLAIYVFRGISCRDTFFIKLWKQVTIDFLHKLVAEFPELAKKHKVMNAYKELHVYLKFHVVNKQISDDEKDILVDKIKLLMRCIERDRVYVKKTLRLLMSFLTSSVDLRQYYHDLVLRFFVPVKEICSYIDVDSQEVVKTFVCELTEDPSFWGSCLVASFLPYMQKNHNDLFKKMLNFLLERLSSLEQDSKEKFLMKNVLKEVSLVWTEDMKNVIFAGLDNEKFLLLMSLIKQFSFVQRKEILSLVLESIKEENLNIKTGAFQMYLYADLVERFIRHEDCLDKNTVNKVAMLLTGIVNCELFNDIDRVVVLNALLPFCTGEKAQSLVRGLLGSYFEEDMNITADNFQFLQCVSGLLRVYCPEDYELVQKQVLAFELKNINDHEGILVYFATLSCFSKDLKQIDESFLTDLLDFCSEYLQYFNMSDGKELLVSNIHLFLDLIFYYLEQDEKLIDKELLTYILTALSSIYKDEDFGYQVREVRGQLIKALKKVLPADEVLKALPKMLLEEVDIKGNLLLFEQWRECCGDVEKENALFTKLGITVQRPEPDSGYGLNNN